MTDLNREEIKSAMNSIGAFARKAAWQLATASNEAKSLAITSAASNLRDATSAILKANQLDLNNAAENKLSAAMIDRLTTSR